MAKRKVEFPHWNDLDAKQLHNPFADISISTLNNYLRELDALISACDRQRARLCSVRVMVDEAHRHKIEPTKLVIADHAVVRYLERYKGFDIEAICEEIAARAENGDKEIAIREGIVVTVLPPGSEARTED